MADTKISGLTSITGANVDPAADVLPIVDTSVATTKKILVSELFTNSTLVAPALGTPASGDITNLAASQAQQEAGTALTAAVTPGRQQFHPSAAKGWVYFGLTGNVITSYNVTSVSDDSAGAATISWATDFSTANYAVSICIEDDQGAATPNICQINDTGCTAGTTSCISKNASTGANRDPTKGYRVIAFGDQA